MKEENEMMLKSNEHMYVRSSSIFRYIFFFSRKSKREREKKSIFFSKDQGRVQ